MKEIKETFYITKEDHFNGLRETSLEVWPAIEEVVSQSIEVCPGVAKDMDVFLARRKVDVENRRMLLRPYLTRLVYALSGAGNWRQMLPLFAASELHNISTYQTNLAFDKKFEHGHTTGANQVISAMISLAAANACFERIEKQGSGTPVQSARASHWLARCNKDVYLGQYLDLNVLTVEGFPGFPDQETFLTAYLQRCRLMGGATFQPALMGAFFSERPLHEGLIETLSEFLFQLGTGTQITNDFGDFSPDETRPYTSQFVDLQQGRLTYPVYMLIRDGFEPALNIVRGGPPRRDDLIACHQRLVDLDAYGQARQLLEERVWVDLEKALHKIKDHVGVSLARPLTFAHQFLFGSKYIRSLKRNHA